MKVQTESPVAVYADVDTRLKFLSVDGIVEDAAIHVWSNQRHGQDITYTECSQG
jgi:hypothetical protein